MLEKVITTKRGAYGRVQIVLPLSIKASILEQAKMAGMSKAELLRKALLLGASQVLPEQQLRAHCPDGCRTGELLQQPART